MFLNRPGFEAGPGCALHLHAMNTGRALQRDQAHRVLAAAAARRRPRRGGRRLGHRRCSPSSAATAGARAARSSRGGARRRPRRSPATSPSTESMEAELREMLGDAVYDEIVKYMRRPARRPARRPSPHPAEVQVSLGRTRIRWRSRDGDGRRRDGARRSSPISTASSASSRRSASPLDDDDWLTPTPGAGLGRPRHDRAPRRHRRDGDRHARPAARLDQRFVSRARVGRGRHATGACCGAGGCAGADVLAWWERTSAAERERCSRELDPDARVPWGIGMRTPSFVTARLMETWAHGLDVRAALGARRGRHRPARAHRLARDPGAPLRLLVRGPEPPATPLRVELTLPSGAQWTHGPADARRPHHRAGRRVLPGVRASPRASPTRTAW